VCEELDQVVAGIKKHLLEFPNAADTVEGIAAWWLVRELPGISKATVEQALELLVESGFVRARRMVNGTVIYALGRNS
jgi:Fe2+ or Zn2+ uptake regulation protein